MSRENDYFCGNCIRNPDDFSEKRYCSDTYYALDGLTSGSFDKSYVKNKFIKIY